MWFSYERSRKSPSPSKPTERPVPKKGERPILKGKGGRLMEESNQYFVKVNDYYVTNFTGFTDDDAIELSTDFFDKYLFRLDDAKSISKLIGGKVFMVTYEEV